MIRQKIYDIVELKEVNSLASRLYNQFMLILVIISMLPLAFKEDYEIFAITDIVVVTVFIVDYLLNWMTADIRYGQRGIWPFIRYPFSLPGIVDMLTILPALAFIHDGFRLLRITRGLRILRMLAVFKMVHHSQNMVLVVRTLKESLDSLLAVGYLAAGYILVSALIIFNVEPQTFPTFFDALYWATVSLTTVGYGDIYPVSTIGRCVTMFSSLLGIALIALPAGIVTAGYLNALQSLHNQGKGR